MAPGVRPFAVAGGFGAGRSGKELKEHLTHGYEAARPGGWDPVERIKDQEIDGVEAEVLYTTLGMPLFGLEDAELQRNCFTVYNDWVAEFCSHSPKRLPRRADFSGRHRRGGQGAGALRQKRPQGRDDLGFGALRPALLQSHVRSVLGRGARPGDAAFAPS